MGDITFENSDSHKLSVKDEIRTAIGRNIDPVELATVYLPRMEYALQVSQTPQETNEIRAQIETVNTYLKHALPKTIRDRRQQFAFTHEADMLYLRASAKAGAMWDACEEKSKPGGDRFSEHSENFPNAISVIDAGFKNSRDATTCKRLAEVHEEDWRTYEEETLAALRQPTPYGLEKIWRDLYAPEEEEIPLPEGIYDVIYADPPWQYQEHGATVSEYYGGADRWHYHSMSIKELCELPVKDIAADDAVLFIWVTSPKLDQVWDIIKAWGFEYKTSFVWDKVKHNFGYYNSVRHEILLVAGRGKSTPENTTLYDSVQSIERTEKHSEKPEEFRAIIEDLYPGGKKIELFARAEHEGWDTWGYEVKDGILQSGRDTK